MDDRAARVFTGLCVLVLMWIGVYWLWQPGSPATTFAEGRARPTSRAAVAEPAVTADAGGEGGQRAGVVEPGFREYVARDGDTFERIAEREFGDASLWTAVARANPLKDPRRMREGVVLRLPLDPGNVQGRPTPSAPAGGEPEAMRTYVVRGGDTLSGISASEYGTSAHARLIFEANRDRLRDMHSLTVGQSLRIPPAPGG